MKSFYQACLQAFAFCTFLPTIAGFLGAYHWCLDLTTHFRPWYLFIQVLALLLFLLLKNRQWTFGCLIFALLNLSQVYPLWIKPQVNTEGLPIKLVQFNVCAPAKNYDPMSQFLLAENPDIVVMEECSERCIANLQKNHVLDHYPHIFRKEPVRHRLVVLSKYPMTVRPLPILYHDPALGWLTLTIGKRSFDLWAMHSTRPSSGALTTMVQIRQFDQLATRIQQQHQPMLLVGDLNISPWNQSFQFLLEKSGLQNSMNGFGFQPSFPTFPAHLKWLPVMPLVPIDHILTSRDFSVTSRQLGPKLQSDHLPVVVRLILKPPV